jgi:hypothetical protein
LAASEEWKSGQTAQHFRDRDHEGIASPEHHGRADERRGGKRLADSPFSLPAAANIRRGGLGIRANAGNMDQALDARFSGESCDPSGSCYMDGIERQSTALRMETDGIHDANNTCYGSGNGGLIIDVGIDRLKAEVNVGKQCCGAFWMP